MLALFSRSAPTQTGSWSSRVAAPLQNIERFYKSRTDMSLKKRRTIARFNLYKLDGFDPEAVNAVLEQWDTSLTGNETLARPLEMPLGELLKKASLITSAQIDMALMEQQTCSKERFGEIISRHGWLKPQTIEFFASRFPKICLGSYRFPLGRYLVDAGLLDSSQVNQILNAQNKSLRKSLFGSIAVSRGYVKKETIEFIVKHLPPIKPGSAAKAKAHLR